MLSNKFARFDNLDALTAVLAGVEHAGVGIDVESGDLPRVFTAGS
jgi:hypothetical protein